MATINRGGVEIPVIDRGGRVRVVGQCEWHIPAPTSRNDVGKEGVVIEIDYDTEHADHLIKVRLDGDPSFDVWFKPEELDPLP